MSTLIYSVAATSLTILISRDFAGARGGTFERANRDSSLADQRLAGDDFCVVGDQLVADRFPAAAEDAASTGLTHPKSKCRIPGQEFDAPAQLTGVARAVQETVDAVRDEV